MKRILLAAALAVAALPLGAQTAEVFASGMVGLQKIVRAPNGRLLVAETGEADNDGRISVISTTGVVTPLIQGLPGGIDNVGDYSGASGIAIDGNTLYVAVGEGTAVRAIDGQFGINPEGLASPLHSAVIEFVFDQPVMNLMSPITLTVDDHWTMADGFEAELQNADGVTAVARALTDFPPFIPDARQVHRPSNPFGLAIHPERPEYLYLSDASLDSIVEIDRDSGRSRRITRFDGIPNPLGFGPPVSDYVPTTVKPYSRGLLVTNLAGFPFAPGVSNVVYIDPATREAHTFIAGLTSAVDIEVMPNPGQRPTFYTLEFSTQFLEGAPGRVMRYDTPEGEVVVDNLATPISMVIDQETGDIYVAEFATGNVIRIQQ